MSTSLPRVTIPANTWVDLYDATGITVGTQLIIQNTGHDEARLTESASTPTTEGYNPLGLGDFITSADTPVGAWAYSRLGTALQIAEA